MGWVEGTPKTFVVLLLENRDGSGRRLELQRASDYSDQDRQLGLDTYCIVTETQATHYGGVTRCAVKQKAVEFWLTKKAAGALGLEELHLPLLVSASVVRRLRQGLIEIFNGSPVTLSENNDEHGRGAASSARSRRRATLKATKDRKA
jgi:hypothetical protein